MSDTTGLQPVRVDDWIVFAQGTEFWIRDLDLAERAALAKPRDIRATIRRAINDGGVTICDNSAAAAGAVPGPLVWVEHVLVLKGNGAAQPADEYYLNEEAALLVVTRLRTKVAIELTRAVIRVFVAVRRGEVAAGTDGENHRLGTLAQPSLADVRACLADHVIPAALRDNDFDTARSAMAALEAMLSRSNSPMSSPLPVPRPKAPRGPAAPISSPTPSASAQAEPTTPTASPTRAQALKRLRLRLGLTQEQMADKGGLGRVDVCRVEGGHNMASSHKMHKGLAQAAALSTDDLSDYLDGKIDIEEVMRRRTAPPPGPQLRLITSTPGEQGGAPQAGSRGQS